MTFAKFIKYSVFIALLGIIPHPVGTSPLTDWCLFSGSKSSRLLAAFYTIISVTFYYLALYFLTNVPIFGPGCYFTYSSYIVIALLGTRLTKKYSLIRTTEFICASSLLFWVWTNFGWWLTTSFYPKDFNGLINCYLAALPYLRNSFLGDCFWGIVIFGMQNEKVNIWWRSLWQKQLCAKAS